MIKSVSIWHALMRQEARILTISRDNRVPRILRQYPDVLTRASGFYIWCHRLIRFRTPAFHAGNTGSNPVGIRLEISFHLHVVQAAITERMKKA